MTNVNNTSETNSTNNNINTRKKIFLSYPVYGQMQSHAIISLYKAMSTAGHAVHISFSQGDSMVTRVRNGAISTFLYEATDCDYYMSIDSDLEIQNIYPSNNIFNKLIAADKDFIGGLYAIKNPYNECSSVTSLLNQPIPNSGLIQMKYLSSGCHLLKRSAVERIARANDKLRYIGDGEVYSDKKCIALYNPLIRSTVTEQDRAPLKRLLSEDWSFCHRATEAGIKIHADTSIGLLHHGAKAYDLFKFKAQVNKPDMPDAKLYDGKDDIKLPTLSPDEIQEALKG